MLARLGAGRAFGHAFPEVGRVARQPSSKQSKENTHVHYSSGTPARASTPRSPDTSAREKTRAAFVPPKPLDVESATRRSRRVASAIRFIRSDVGSGAARCAVAGARQSRSARTAKQASSAPAAPRRWPVAPFVDATSLRRRRAALRAPRAPRARPRVGGRRPRARSRVAAARPGRRRPAARAARRTPAPSGGGADMCTASPPRP